jgi:hypothetical protein
VESPKVINYSRPKLLPSAIQSHRPLYVYCVASETVQFLAFTDRKTHLTFIQDAADSGESVIIVGLL